MSDEVNKHAEIIRDTVFHTYPYNRMGFKPDAPHADDCGGCLINAEVETLISELNTLSSVKMNKALEQIKEERRLLTIDRWDAFERAGVPEEGSVAELVASLVNKQRLLEEDRQLAFENASVVENGSISDLVAELINERDQLLQLLQIVENYINTIATKLKGLS